MLKNNLLGKKFGAWLVISTADNIKSIKNKNTREQTAWLCKCDCGIERIIRSNSLISKSSTSCGCKIIEDGLSIKSNQKFNQLTALIYVGNSQWLCKCDCGKEIITITAHLNSGNTKSCGCLKIDKCRENIQEAIKINTKYEPRITTARKRWKSYCYQDKQCTLTFEQWLNISQMNCFYCGIEPQNKINAFANKKDASQYAKENGWFIYNGVDRINSNCPHTTDNSVPSCWICNRMKSDNLVENFYKSIFMLKTDNIFVPPQQLLFLPQKYLLSSIKAVYRQYLKNYGSMEIDIQTFYTYSQLPCFYCGKNSNESNIFNVYASDKRISKIGKDSANFYYNGIDRVDSNNRHTLDNIVPSCYYCNFAKSNLSIDDFYAWIDRIQQFQKDKNNTTIKI